MGLNHLWIIVAVLVALVVFTRIRSRRASEPKRSPPAAGPRIQGSQISAYIQPRMDAGCLFDHGVQFGRGFRRKEGPELPHNAQCRCEAVPFTFTSSEVFNGALRKVGAPRCSIEDLAESELVTLIERLKRVESGTVPESAADYVAAIAVEDFPEPLQPGLQQFLNERHTYLRETPQPALLPDTSNPDPTDSANST